MKILIDAIPMTGLLTGIARYLRNLYQAVDRLGLAETAYFNGRDLFEDMPAMADSGRWQQMTQSVRRLPDPVVFALRAARWHRYEQRLNRICRSGTGSPRFSLYHETAFTPAKLTDIPTVFSVYDLSLRRYRHTHPRERVWMFEYFIKTRLKYARHMLTISEFIRQEIMDEFKVPASRVSSVPLAPDPVFAPAAPGAVAQVRQRYGLPEEYLVFVSSLEPRKNIELLIEALAAARTDIPLVLVGWHGWGDKAWLEKVHKSRLKDRILFTGHVPEAMACGCPVICSNAASMPEAAGDAALYIDPGDTDSLVHAIDTLVPDTGARQTLKTLGLARAKQFTWEKTARRTLDIFQTVID
jgi:alpha-1,3-rhamnosyl/mannosyltransferase